MFFFIMGLGYQVCLGQFSFSCHFLISVVSFCPYFNPKVILEHFHVHSQFLLENYSCRCLFLYLIKCFETGYIFYIRRANKNAGCNMSIISKVDKHRSFSIQFETNQLTSFGNR